MNWEKQKVDSNITGPDSLFSQMDDAVTVLLKAAVPSFVFSFLLPARVPKIPVCFNDSVLTWDEEVDVVSADFELSGKLNTLGAELLANESFQIRKSGISVTLKAAKDTSTDCNLRRLNLKRPIAKGADTFNSFLSAKEKTLDRTKLVPSVLHLARSYVDRLSTLKTVQMLASLPCFAFARLRAELASTMSHVTRVSAKFSVADDTYPFKKYTHRFAYQF